MLKLKSLGMTSDFLVIDTEGKPQLREIAIFNASGKLVYEAYSQDSPQNRSQRANLTPLKQIITDFLTLTKSKLLVFHYAKHDLEVLKNSCKFVGLPWQSRSFECTYELAQVKFPNLVSYSLEYLSKHLQLKVNNKYFSPLQAHSAKYDAEFTYKLYCKINRKQMYEDLKNKPNPFSSSRVDTPFQYHADLKVVYQQEFELLRSIIADIKQDPNHQSKGAVVIGEPGSGKTHLMMRLAQELFQVNRLLFIRQPNNSQTVLYHTYSRILESLIEKIPGRNQTQLEALLANSFIKLLRGMTQTKKDQEIIAVVKDDYRSLYNRLGAEGTQRKRESWQHIEKRTNEWWLSQYGSAGYSPQIIKGIIKFCSYTDRRRQELVTRWLSANELTSEELELVGLSNWHEEMSREAFSLEAIAVFSKLSLLDEPLIIIFDQLEGLGLKHNEILLKNFGEAVKEIFTHVSNSLIILNLFPDRWQQFQEFFDGSIVDRVSQYPVYLQRPDNDKLKEILRVKAQTVNVDLDTLFTPTQFEDILNQPSIRRVLNTAAHYYRYQLQGISLPTTPPEASTYQNSVASRLQILETGFTKLHSIVNEIANQLLVQSSEKTLSEVTLTRPVTKPSELPINHPITAPITPKPLPNLPSVQDETQENLSIYLKNQTKQLQEKYDKLQIISDSDDLGKLTTIAEAFKTIKELEFSYLRLGKRVIPEHIVITTSRQPTSIGFLQVDGSSFTSRIKNHNELVIAHPNINFILIRDIRQNLITGKVGREEIEKLNSASNGRFMPLNQEQRIEFELLYKLIIDVQNYDLEINIDIALNLALSSMKDNWLLRLFSTDHL